MRLKLKRGVITQRAQNKSYSKLASIPSYTLGLVAGIALIIILVECPHKDKNINTCVCVCVVVKGTKV